MYFQNANVENLNIFNHNHVCVIYVSECRHDRLVSVDYLIILETFLKQFQVDFWGILIFILYTKIISMIEGRFPIDRFIIIGGYHNFMR